MRRNHGRGVIRLGRRFATATARARVPARPATVLEAGRDAELARRAAGSEREALRCLYEQYADELFAVAHRLTDSAADARDVLHDAFSGLPTSLQTFDYEQPVGPWLRAVTSRAALMLLRTRSRRCEVSISRDDVACSRPVGVLDSIALERALASLPDRLRSVLILKEIEGYSHKEIGKLLNIDPSASAVRLFRARERLRALLGER